MRKFFARVINFPQELTALITLALSGAFLWVEVQLTELLGIDFSGWIVPLGAGIATFIAFAVKALLEKYVPEPAHGVINAILGWLAVALGGLVGYRLAVLVF